METNDIFANVEVLGDCTGDCDFTGDHLCDYPVGRGEGR